MITIDPHHSKALLFDLQGTLISLEMLSLLAAREKQRSRYFEEEIELMPGALDLISLAKSKGMKVAIVTAASKETVQYFLKYFSLEEAVDQVISADDVSRSKPDPECYILALDSLEVTPEEAIVFEDTDSGMQAARALGIRTIAVSRDGSHFEKLGVSETAEDFRSVEIKDGDE